MDNNKLNQILAESIQATKDEMLAESIRPMIGKALKECILEAKKPNYAKTSKEKHGKIKVSTLVDKLMKNPEFKKKAMEYLTDEDAYNGWSENLKGKTYDTLDNLSDGSKRRTVSQKLKDKKIDFAPIAYELWPNMSPDAARSWFSKKVDGKNESFSDAEISKIYNLLNNTIN